MNAWCRPVTFEERLPDANGTERTYLRNMYPLLDKNGDAEFLIGHGMDITARKKANWNCSAWSLSLKKPMAS
jgi:PAS domain-containing protein